MSGKDCGDGFLGGCFQIFFMGESSVNSTGKKLGGSFFQMFV